MDYYSVTTTAGSGGNISAAVLGMDEKKIGNSLAREMGIVRLTQKTDAAIKIAKAPEVEYPNYVTKVTALETEAGKQVKADYDKLIKLGYDTEKALNVAKRKASNWVMGELELLDMEFPMVSNADFLMSAAAKVPMSGVRQKNSEIIQQKRTKKKAKK